MSRSPTLETVAVCVVVFCLQAAVSLVGFASVGLFALAAPLEFRPWTLVTNVYAHASVGHLVTNLLSLVFLGLLVERRTTRARFHGFFLSVGMLAAVAEVTLGGALGGSRGVLGASGAVFGLLGYLLASNVVSERFFERVKVSRRAQLGLFVVIAVAVTVATGQPGVALIAHFTGLLLGLIAGRLDMLEAR
ncbi:rhomboid family intramembrane serine protease [Haloferacaceae archaeon DSL9]